MIATKSLFFRVDRALKLRNSCTALEPLGYFRGYKTYHALNYNTVNMADRKGKQIQGERGKKLKPINPVWRPVTTQARSFEDCSSNVKGQSEAEFSSSVRHHTSTSVSSGLDGTDEGRVSVGQSVVAPKKYSISVEVGASLIRFIKEKGGSTQKKIEEEMGVTIVLPSSRKDDFVIIEGVSVDSLAKAEARIKTLIDQAINSPSLDYSHFISLPLAMHPELVDKLIKFQNSILGDVEGITNVPLVSYAPKSFKPPAQDDSGIEKSIFINPKTFHLTVIMLKLWNKKRVDAAAEVLQSISSQVMDALDNRPISIRLRGLDCMRGSLAKAFVVYAPVEEIGGEGRLLRACQVIIDAFVKAGLVLEKDANRSLKLHATVMNARHRKWTEGRKMADSFDARSIFKQYGSKDWGEYVIREAHLSQRFLYDDNGYYHRCASIPFPEHIEVE